MTYQKNAPIEDQAASRSASNSTAEFPHFREKIISDLANGIVVAKEQIRLSSTRASPGSRLYDSLTGTHFARDLEIQRTLTQSQDAVLAWVSELSKDHERSNLALASMQRSMNRISAALSTSINFSADVRHRVSTLEKSLIASINDHNARIKKLEALSNVDISCVKLESGCYSRIPLLQGIYAVLDENYWGSFGDHYRLLLSQPNASNQAKELRDYLSAKLISIADKRTGGERVSISTLLYNADGVPQETSEVIAYLGDWAAERYQPFSYASTQRTDKLPLLLPLRVNSSRVINGMYAEIFGDRTS